MYQLDHTNIEMYGARALVKGSRIALEGVFDFPKRKGASERNWGTGIEPFVDPRDIEFDGRSLRLNVLLSGETPEEYLSNLSAFRAACISCRKLSTGYADFDVVLKDDVKVKEYLKHNRAIITATFWQRNVDFGALPAPASGSGYHIDGYNLRECFGIRVVERRDNNSVGKRIEIATTTPYEQTRYRDHTAIVLKCYMRGEGFADLYGKMVQFHSLCASPGLRVLRFPDSMQYTGYVKDGFSVKAVHRTRLDFDFKLRVI